MSVAMPRTNTRGVVYVHSSPDSAVPAHHAGRSRRSSAAGSPLDWTAQPAAPGTGAHRADAGPASAGTGARLASALRGWDHLRYEVTEEPSPGCDGSRWSYTPAPRHPPHLDLGQRRRRRSTRTACARSLLRTHGDAEALQDEIDVLLGTDWDDELEPFRYAGDGAPVRWLHKVG